MNESEFDELVDKWHSDESIIEPLHEFLGMSFSEYSKYVNLESKINNNISFDMIDMNLDD